MQGRDLDLRDLLSFDPEGGIIRFAGERAVIMDTLALGLWRKELIETVGVHVARGILTRFGFAHGWRMAQAMEHAFPWDDARAWRVAGGRLHMLQGLVIFEPVEEKVDDPSNRKPTHAEAIWHRSFEAEQHCIHHGTSETPVCWTMCGFASGYLSFCHRVEIYCIETQCIAAGAHACHMEGRRRSEWGTEIDADLPYFEKQDLDQALTTLTDRLREIETTLEARQRVLQRADEDWGDLDGMIVLSDAMKGVVTLAKRVAQFDTSVLVTGESGTGKELVARRVHAWSERASRAFVAINCGALSEHLLESELFGHAKGAFTGATQARAGLFEAADGGTLFLDEIGDISQTMQVKLLRALQEREVTRVGETTARSVNVRVIAATHRDLGEEVKAGRFRQDLLYRLRVVEIKIPPLRARTGAVLTIARKLLERHAACMNRHDLQGFTPNAAALLKRYTWPGNVRELENAMEYALVVSQGPRIDVTDLPEEVQHGAAQPHLDLNEVRPLRDIERAAIEHALEHFDGNRAQTARALGIGEATLYRKLKQYAADSPA